MKAIISISKTSQGDFVKLLGLGVTESAARIYANETVSGGPERYFDKEYEGGMLVDVSEEVAKLHRDADEEIIDYYDYKNALQGLYVENNTLKLRGIK